MMSIELALYQLQDLGYEVEEIYESRPGRRFLTALEVKSRGLVEDLLEELSPDLQVQLQAQRVAPDAVLLVVSSPAGTRPDLEQVPGADERLRLLPTRTALGGERDAVRDFSDQEGGR